MTNERYEQLAKFVEGVSNAALGVSRAAYSLACAESLGDNKDRRPGEPMSLSAHQLISDAVGWHEWPAVKAALIAAARANLADAEAKFAALEEPK